MDDDTTIGPLVHIVNIGHFPLPDRSMTMTRAIIHRYERLEADVDSTFELLCGLRRETYSRCTVQNNVRPVCSWGTE